MLAERIVYFCYFLEESQSYKKTKDFFYDLLENPQSALRSYFDLTMAVLILLSVFALIYEVKNPLPGYGVWFESLLVVILVLEYLLRLWLYSDSRKTVIDEYEKTRFLNTRFYLHRALRRVLREKWQYFISPMAIVDLLAILPSYRPLRVLRFFLLFRVFKLFRYTRNVNEFSRVLLEKRFELYTLLILVGFVTFASATAIYIFEATDDKSQINTFFDAIYWALITLSTVGYGDITPQSTAGRVVTLVLIMSGIGVIAFVTSIVVSAFSEKMQELRMRQVFYTVQKNRDWIVVCGFGRVGESVAERLAGAGNRFIVIDKNEERVELAKERGYLAIRGDAGQTGLLENIGIRDRVASVLCVTDDDVSNVYITLTARALNPQATIISRTSTQEAQKKLYRAGASHVVTPYEVVGLMAAEYIGQPVATRAINSILSGEHHMSLEVIQVGAGCYLAGNPLSAADFTGARLILFGIITPQGQERHSRRRHFELQESRFYFHPEPHFVVLAGDLLVVFGRSLSIGHFRDQLEKSALRRKRQK